MYRIYYFVKDLPKEIKWAWQRLTRGWSDRDAWNFNDYLAGVIAGGLKKLSEDKSSYPINSTPKKWDKALEDMIKGFESNSAIFEFGFEKKKLLKCEKAFKKGMELFAKHFNNLWD